MTDSTQSAKPTVPAKNRRACLSDFLILAGGCLLFFTALFGLKISLAASQWADETYLVSTVDFQLPLPTLTAPALAASTLTEPTFIAPTLSEPTPTAPILIEPTLAAPTLSEPTLAVSTLTEPTPTAPILIEPTLAAPPLTDTSLAVPATAEPRRGGSMLYLPLVSKSLPPEEPLENPITLNGSIPGLAPVESAGPVVRLVIPQLKIDRAVVTIGLHQQDGSAMQWNTDILFANRNRPDLVGQIITSVNPGDGGNIVLVGHNYNEGWNGWGAVFVDLGNLSPGSKITVYTENGGEYTYVVQAVKKVPWRRQNTAELAKHQKFMWPTEREQLTLVTCGGELLGKWSARIYVVAYPEAQNSN